MLMAALATTGCSQNEITEISPDANPAIGFSAYTGVQTKGTVINTTDICTSGFGVMAIKGGSNVYMTSRQVTSKNSGTSWTYPIAAYWPTDGAALSFYSYAPYSGTGITATSFDDDATPEIAFTIQNTWANTIDLLAAKNADVTSGTSVSVSLKHILTRIAFTATTSEDLTGTGTQAYITGVKVLQAKSTKFYQSATYNLATEAWTGGVKITGDYPIIESDIEVTSSNSALPTSLTGADQYLFCIPVERLTVGDIQLEVSYKTVINSVESSKTVQLNIPTDHFAKGTAYSYNLEITMGKIVFTGAVDDTWGIGSGNLVPVVP